MPRNTSLQFGLPRFQGVVRYIILVTLGIWVTILLLWAFAKPVAALLLSIGQLDPGSVLHGRVWQLVTYPFIHIDPGT